MANVKISNLPVETTLANMTGIAGYNAAGTAQISGANIISGAAQPDQNLASVLATGSIATSGQTITLANSGSNTNTTMSVNSISSDTSFSIIGTTTNTNLTLTSGGELRITPNASLGTPATGDVLAAKNNLGDVEWVSAGGSTPTLQQVLDSGNTADSNGNTGTIVLTNSAQNRTATYGNENITTDYTFGIDVSGSNNSARMSTADGDVFIRAQGTGKDITLKANGMEFEDMGVISLKPATNIPGVPTCGFGIINGDFLLEGYNQTSSQGGNIRLNSRGSMVIHTGNLSTSTPGGSLSLYARGNTASLSTIDGTTIGGNVTISSSSGDVIITGGENLVLTNTGLGTPAVGDVLTAKTTGGVAEWTTPSSGGVEAFTSLTSADAITWDASVSTNAEIQLGNFLNVLSITNATSGMHFSLLIDASANDVLIFPNTFYGPSNLPNWIPSIPTADNYVIQFFYDGSNFFVTTEANTKEVLDIGNIVGNGLQLYFDAQTFQAAGSNSTWPSIGSAYGNTAVVTTGTAPTLNQETNVDPGTGQNVVNYYLTTNDQSMRTAIDPGSVMATTNSYTQQVWVRITGVNTYNGITDFDPTESYSMYYEDTPSPGYIYMSETGSSSDGQGDMPANTGTSSADWANVAITFNSTGVDATCEMNIYVNGQLEDTVTGGMGTGPGSAGTSAYIDMLSSSSGTSIYGFEGDASIIMYYNRAISGTEVLANYDDQKGRFGLS